MTRVLTVYGLEQPFELSESAQLLPFKGMDMLLTSINAGSEFAGGDALVAQDPYVNMFAATTPDDSTGLPAIAQQVESCLQCCRKIRDKSASGGSSIGLHQVCAIVERTFTVDISLPKPGEGYEANGVTLEVQQALIRDLLGVSMQYVSACKSKNSDRGMDAAHAVTMGAILAVTDAAVRVEACDTPSAVHQVISGKADSMLHMISAPAEAEDAAPAEIKCPKGHALKEETHPGGNRWCDLCGSKVSCQLDTIRQQLQRKNEMLRSLTN